ncbi:MAG: hypothetical protein ACI9TV_001436 [Sulfurimonas sp.]|jgi:uncharacterized protein (DUF3820 family)|uniref:putative quorum-sensing-regulated virulence factor n=1 Tax=Sulfurimonas sp. TaxID=2022749 RepID=UPI0039E63D67
MPKAHLVFTHFHNSYSVKIPNLEKLSVEQIQELENFTHQRKGIFDFETYSFSIQKRIEFYQFSALIESLNIDARIEEHIIVKETAPRIGFGQYKGMQYNELPNSYMLWLKGNYRGFDRVKVDKELKKRNL